jgi:glucokinase
MKNILTADIGGTNSRFAHFKIGLDGALALVETKWLKTHDSPSFADLLDSLWKSNFGLTAEKTDMAVFAVAGPVERNVYSNPPYISWDIDIASAHSDFGLSHCVLMNDFLAQAFACRSPVIESTVQVLKGEVDPEAPLAVLGAGTGLGMAALVPDRSGGYVAVPSEGGHSIFPFESAREWDYMGFLKREVGEDYNTGNTVVSGRGLRLLHKYLTGEDLAPQEVAKRLGDDSETLAWAARFYGRACRHCALQVVARGGVYIAGGVAAKLPALVMHRAFADEFRFSSSMGELLRKIPVFLNRNEESGLWGAAVAAGQYLSFVNPVH